MFSSLRTAEVVTAQAVKRYRFTRGVILQSGKSCQEGVFEGLKWHKKGFCFNRNQLDFRHAANRRINGLSANHGQTFSYCAPDGDTAN